MTAASLRLELELTRRRTRWTMVTSFVIHVLLLLWIMNIRTEVKELPVVTEIALLEPGDLAAASSPSTSNAPAAPQLQTVPGATVKNTDETHFLRREPKADVALDPQAANAISDQLTSRLAAMQQNAQPIAVGTSTTAIPASMFGAPATVPSAGGSGTAPVRLNRGGTGGGGTALELTRGPGAGGSSLGPATVSPGVKSAASAPAGTGTGDATAQRTVAGVSLMGPVANRAVLFYTLPVYPDWAKKEAVEGSVTLYFVVRPDGTVKENVLVQKTAGFGDFDENARTALRAWRFEPLKGGRTGEQWGTITFHFKLQSAE